MSDAVKEIEPMNAGVWIVIAAHNESDVITDVLRRVLERYIHVVVVDDGSRDDTAALAHRQGAYVLRHPINLGQGAALETGIEYAIAHGARYVATFDADGQHSVDDLGHMLRELHRRGADIIVGSRFLGDAINIPVSRKLLLWLATVFTNATTGVRLTDAHNGLRVMTAQTAARLDLQQNRMAHASEIIRRIRVLRLRYAEVPVSIRYTAYSMRKGQRLRDAGRVLGDLFSDWLSR